MFAAAQYPASHEASEEAYEDNDFESVSDVDDTPPSDHHAVEAVAPAGQHSRTTSRTSSSSSSSGMPWDRKSEEKASSRSSNHSAAAREEPAQETAAAISDSRLSHEERHSVSSASLKGSNHIAKVSHPSTEKAPSKGHGASSSSARSSSLSSSSSTSSRQSHSSAHSSAHEEVVALSASAGDDDKHSQDDEYKQHSSTASQAGKTYPSEHVEPTAATAQAVGSARYSPNSPSSSSASSSAPSSRPASHNAGFRIRAAASAPATAAPAADEHGGAATAATRAETPSPTRCRSHSHSRNSRKVKATRGTYSFAGSRDRRGSSAGETALRTSTADSGAVAPAAVPQTAEELRELQHENDALREEVYQRQRNLYHVSLTASRTEVRKAASRKETAAQHVREAVLLDRAVQMMRREHRELTQQRAQLQEEVVKHRRALKYQRLIEEANANIAALQEENRDLRLEMRCNEKLLLMNANVLESGAGAKQLQEEVRARNALVQRQAVHALRDADEAERQRDALRQRVNALQEKLNARQGATSSTSYAELQALRDERRRRSRRVKELKAAIGKRQRSSKAAVAGTREGAEGRKGAAAHQSPSHMDAEREYLQERIAYMRSELAQSATEHNTRASHLHSDDEYEHREPVSSAGNGGGSHGHGSRRSTDSEVTRYQRSAEEAEASACEAEAAEDEEHYQPETGVPPREEPVPVPDRAAIWLDDAGNTAHAAKHSQTSSHSSSSILSRSARSGRRAVPAEVRAAAPTDSAAASPAAVRAHPTHEAYSEEAHSQGNVVQTLQVDARPEEAESASVKETDNAPAWLDGHSAYAAAGATGSVCTEPQPASSAHRTPEPHSLLAVDEEKHHSVNEHPIGATGTLGEPQSLYEEEDEEEESTAQVEEDYEEEDVVDEEEVEKLDDDRHAAPAVVAEEDDTPEWLKF